MPKTVDFIYGKVDDNVVGFFCEHLKHHWPQDYYVNKTTDGYTVIVCAECKDNLAVLGQLLAGIRANKAEFDKFIAEARPGSDPESRLVPKKVFTKKGVHIEHTN